LRDILSRPKGLQEVLVPNLGALGGHFVLRFSAVGTVVVSAFAVVCCCVLL
jgi:hypothetical protein